MLDISETVVAIGAAPVRLPMNCLHYSNQSAQNNWELFRTFEIHVGDDREILSVAIN